jgi:outer membrane protein
MQLRNFPVPRFTIASLLAMILAVPAYAQEAGQWLVRVGATSINPDSDNGTLFIPTAVDVDVDDAWGLTFNVSYFFTERWAVELLAAAPYNHEFDLKGTGISGETDHLPPTLSVQYHFPVSERITPYVGLGVNWTIFFDEDLSVPVNLELDDSVGVAAQLGMDIDLNENWFMNVDVRYIKIESDAEVAGVDVGTVKINPWLFGVNVGYRF